MPMLNILSTLWQEVTDFLSIEPVIKMVQTGDYSSLRTLEGLENALAPLIPVLLVVELVRALLFRRFRAIDYKVQFLTYVFNRIVGRFISIGLVLWCIGWASPLAILKSSITWYWLIYGYIVWEFAHYIYHYLGHKVRLFWCLHSTHHAPETMNLSVSYAHFFLEGPYADVIRTSICILAGVSPELLALIMFIDGTWGGFIHVGENLIKDGRLGFLRHVMLTPSHHRVHHARNPLYMDTNFCNLLNVWDRVFGTHEPERNDIPVEYGITRPINRGSFWDMYFGEIMALAKDVYHAPGLKNKILYVFMPPGWSHTGDHKTARVARRNFLAQQK
jgi:sterol desaturase/sphingolipid hydroxylase (fatty acid hydroxylase superfamily)